MDAVIDELVLTASNEAQARGYEASLRSMQRDGRLAGVGGWRVIPDPPGPRVGSGAATMLALQSLRATGFAGRRIAIVHSGGESRRLPAYAALGKVFVPLPITDDRGRTRRLLDLILDDLRALFARVHGGRVVIVAGDVYLGLERGLDLGVPGAAGVAFPASRAVASRHGVFVTDRRGRVVRTLQKPTRTQLRAAGAGPRPLVDTGVLSLDAPAAEWLARRARALGPVLAGHAPPIDLYEHVIPGLVASSVRGSPRFTLRVVPRCAFMHVGTTRQLLDLPRILRRALRVVAPAAIPIDCAGVRPSVRGTAFVESCRFDAKATLDGRNVLSHWPVGSPGRLPRGVGLTCLPIAARRWAVVAFGDRDDFKTPASRGGTLVNRPLAPFTSVRPLWPAGTPRTAWDARVWRIGGLAESLRAARRVIRDGAADHAPGERLWSLGELLPRVNHRRLISLRDDAARAARLEHLPDRLAAFPWLHAARLAADAASPREARTACTNIARLLARRPAALERARLWRVAQRLVERHPACGGPLRISSPAQAEARAFREVAASVSDASLRARPPRPGILADQVVWVTCPVRIDLAGGWSDTPPICQAFGGSVVNAAITLNGQYPIQVVCRRSSTPGVRLTSIDLGRTIHLRSAREALRHDDPHDWAALPKAALVVSGLAPARPGVRLRDWLAPIGGGLELTFFSALPKGSGLGTSSIFGAAMLAALARAAGESLAHETLVQRTTSLEQRMTTGGGWQDQAGGVYPGVKLLTTPPGTAQSPRMQRAPGDGGLRDPEARARMLLYYTGQRRLARNILRNVVGRYLDRDPALARIIDRLRAGAAETFAALREGDLRGLARGVLDFWSLKKEIDAGATNPALEALIARVSPMLDGYALPGAGGGGFLFMIARDDRAAARVRRVLSRRPPNALARFYDFEIDTRGLGVSVL